MCCWTEIVFQTIFIVKKTTWIQFFPLAMCYIFGVIVYIWSTGGLCIFKLKKFFFYYFCRRIEEFTNTHYTLSHTKLNCKECSQSTSDVQTVFRKFCRALHQYTQMRLNITHTRLQTLCITLYYTDLVYCWLYVYRIVVHSRKRVEERGPFFGQFLYINSL